MSFRDCLVKAFDAGAISAKKLAEGLAKVDQYRLDLEKSGLSPQEALDRATHIAQEEYEYSVVESKKQLVLAVAAKQRGEQVITAAGARPVRGLLDAFERTERTEGLIKQMVAGRVSDFFVRYAKGNFLGKFLRDEKDADLFGREMMGEDTGSAAHKDFAKQAQETSNYLRRRANEAGATIRELKNYGLTTVHDAVAFGRAGFEQFFKDVTSPTSPMRWAVEKMYDASGRRLDTYKPAELRDAIQELFNSVKDGDWMAASQGGGSLADRMSRSRFVNFSDYDSWKAYNKKYGASGGDPVNAVQTNWNRYARDISMLESFGPNPHTAIQYLKDFASRRAKDLMAADTAPQKGSSLVETAQRDIKNFEGIYDRRMGNNAPLSKWGAAYGTTRNAIFAAKIIPQAFLSQATVDPIFRIPNLKMQYNLPMNSILRNWISYLPSLGSKEARQLALRLGFSGEDILNSLHDGHLMRDHPIYGASMGMSDFFGRLFTVHAHMAVMPQIFARDLLASFARWNDTAFEELPIAAALKREGITAADWEDFRKTPSYTHKGVDYLVPNDVMARGDLTPARAREVGEKFGLFVNGASREAVPALNAKTGFALTGNPDPNSVGGMIVKDMTMATYFAASTAAMLYRGFMLRNGLASRVAYVAAATTTLLAANAMRMQAKAIAAGRDPYDMNPTTKGGREFWLTNAETSGAAGPTLDLLNPNHKGGVSELISSIAKTSYHGARHLLGMEEKDPNFSGKMFDIARHMLPGADGWYSKLLVQHMMLDQLQREVDPNAYESWQRTQNYYQRNYGQSYWWRPGQATPDRAPDIGAIYQKQ